MNKATGANRGDQRRGSAPSRSDHGAVAEMISERSRSQREHNCRPDGSANLLPRCANSMRDQKPRLRKFACLAAITAMLALSGRAAERDLDDLLLVRLPAPPEGRLNYSLARPELYNLASDADESYDVAPQNLQIVAEIQRRINSLLPSFPGEVQKSWAEAQKRRSNLSVPAGAYPRPNL